MKNTLLTFLVLITFCSFSQKKDKSSGFDTPEGDCEMIQLKNGNTLLMEITKKEGIKVLLFDTLRKKVSGTLKTKLIGEKIGYYIHEGLFEMGGDAVCYLQIAEDRTPILIRLTIDGKTGKLKSEEKVSQLERVERGGAYAMAFGGVEIPDFDVVKDPESDYYAIIRYNTMAKETKDRIEVLHYSPEHKLINKTNYTAPNNKFKYTNYLSAYVNKDNYVVIATYAFNTEKSGGEEGRFYVSQLAKGKSTFKQEELSYKEYYKSAQCIFKYNKVNSMIHMILITGTEIKGKDRIFHYNLQNLNPSNLKVEKPYGPDFTNVNNYYRKTMEREEDYQGILQTAFFDKSGNLILFFQQINVERYTVDNEQKSKTYYGDVALLTVSPEGKTINSAVFPLNYLASNLSKLYRSAFATILVATENSNYLLFNNTVKNMEKPDSEESKAVKALGPLVPVKYTYVNNSVKREYLFGNPKEEKGNPFCYFGASSYSKSKKTLATLYFDPKSKKTCAIWLKVE